MTLQTLGITECEECAVLPLSNTSASTLATAATGIDLELKIYDCPPDGTGCNRCRSAIAPSAKMMGNKAMALTLCMSCGEIGATAAEVRGLKIYKAPTELCCNFCRFGIVSGSDFYGNKASSRCTLHFIRQLQNYFAAPQTVFRLIIILF
jgi:hypothetical protein